MIKQPFKAPSYKEAAFNCPFCNAYAKQSWSDLVNDYHSILQKTRIAYCSCCSNYSIWHEEKMIYPDASGVDLPNEDLEDDIKFDCLEAASIINKSPRGSTALLRLAVQKLCKQLGGGGKDINADIKELVKKGLSTTIQQALDSLRVIGNESVHPGQIDLRDDPETAQALFKLLNKISETMITEPRQIQEIYEKIPTEKKRAIEERDKNATKT